MPLSPRDGAHPRRRQRTGRDGAIAAAPRRATFAGRDTELAALDRLLAQTDHAGRPAAAVIISRCPAPRHRQDRARPAMGHLVAPTFPDGQLYVNLRGSRPDRDGSDPA